MEGVDKEVPSPFVKLGGGRRGGGRGEGREHWFCSWKLQISLSSHRAEALFSGLYLAPSFKTEELIFQGGSPGAGLRNRWNRGQIWHMTHFCT